MTKYWYSTKKDKKGRVIRYRHWKQGFKDEGTGEVIYINRKEIIKVNGHKMRFYSYSEIDRMTPEQKKEIFNY